MKGSMTGKHKVSQGVFQLVRGAGIHPMEDRKPQLISVGRDDFLIASDDCSSIEIRSSETGKHLIYAGWCALKNRAEKLCSNTYIRHASLYKLPFR